MSKLGAILVLAVVIGAARSSVVVPVVCPSGGGSGVNFVNYVVGMDPTQSVTGQFQPYNLTCGVTYNVTFTFLSIQSTSAPTKFSVLQTDANNNAKEIASVPVGPFDATTVTQVLKACPLTLQIQIMTATKLSIAALCNLDWITLLNTVPDTLMTQAFTYTTSLSASIPITLDCSLANTSITLSGIIYGQGTDIIVCRQGKVIVVLA